MKKLLISWPLILVMLVGAGCAGYTPQVPMPGEDGGPIAWEEYYKDQFKAFRDDVPPPGAGASMAQLVAYDDALSSYNTKKTIGLVISVGLLGCSVLLLAGTMSQM